jgi:hypothetical protein
MNSSSPRGIRTAAWMVSLIYFSSIAEKFRGEYLVNLAAMQIIRGTAERSEQVSRAASADDDRPHFVIAGRPIRLASPPRIAVRDGDDIIVAGHVLASGFVGLAMRNVTQSQSERSWDFWSQLEILIIVIFGLGAPAGLFVSTPNEVNPFIALRYLLIIVIWSLTVRELLFRFYSWKLIQEASKRVMSLTN